MKTLKANNRWEVDMSPFALPAHRLARHSQVRIIFMLNGRQPRFHFPKISNQQ